jgi:hypothetical protein
VGGCTTIDTLELFVILGPLPPGGAEDVLLHPAFETPLNGFGGKPARPEHLPGNTGHQDVKQAVQAVPVALGRVAVAAPDDRWQQRLEDFPKVIG